MIYFFNKWIKVTHLMWKLTRTLYWKFSLQNNLILKCSPKKDSKIQYYTRVYNKRAGEENMNSETPPQNPNKSIFPKKKYFLNNWCGNSHDFLLMFFFGAQLPQIRMIQVLKGDSRNKEELVVKFNHWWCPIKNPATILPDTP